MTFGNFGKFSASFPSVTPITWKLDFFFLPCPAFLFDSSVVSLPWVFVYLFIFNALIWVFSARFLSSSPILFDALCPLLFQPSIKTLTSVFWWNSLSFYNF